MQFRPTPGRLRPTCPQSPSVRPGRVLALQLPLMLIAGALFAAPQTPPAGEPGVNPAPENSTTPRVRTIRVLQSANGLPNQPTRTPVQQELLVTDGKLRLDDLQSKVVYLLQIVDGVAQVQEVSIDGTQYTEGENLGELQRSRDIAERQTLERLRKESAIERKAAMQKLHLREGLEREVVVERPEGKQTILGYECERVIVRENDRVVIDAWLTDELDFDIPFFRFYNKLGAFSDEVLAKIQDLEGMPLRAAFTVVTASLTYPISVEAVTPPMLEEVPEGYFHVPPDATKIERQEIATCPICGKQVEVAAAVRCGMNLDKTQVYACSNECRQEFLKRMREERKKRREGRD